MVLPMGYATIERTVPAEAAEGDADAIAAAPHNIGMRLHYLEGPQSEGFARLKNAAKMQKDQAFADDTNLGYWELVLGEIEKIKAKESKKQSEEPQAC